MVGRPYPSPSSRRLTSSREWHRDRDKCMHLSIGLHTSAGKSYPQPLQPAKHRGIAPNINQRLRTDRPNYLSKLRSRESFFDSSGQKISTCRRWKTQPHSQAPQAPQEATYIGSEIPTIFTPDQQALSQHHTHHLHRSKKRPLLVSKRTSTTHPIVPVLLTRVTSTGSVYRYMGTWAELYRMAKKAI